MTALHELSAVELVAAYRRHALSPVEVATALLEHVQRWEPHLHASYLLRPELTLEQARASLSRWMRGAPCGPLDGVPVTIKENIATLGDPVPLGTAASELKPSPVNAPPAQRLREAGAVLLCKTTMPDYGMLSSGVSSFHASARNPWDTTKGPGGSSAGAGAGAAAGYGPLHIGTDIGGSVRLPAAWCGVFGFKPSLGRVPIDPPYTGRAAGPITRTVQDAALMMQVLSAPDVRDSMSLPPQHIDWDTATTRPRRLHGLRLGLLLDAGCGLPVQPQVQAAVQAAAELFEDAGAIIVPMQPFFTREMLDGMDHFWRMRSWMDLCKLDAPRRERVLPFIRTWAESAAGFSAAHLYEASQQFYATRVATVRACSQVDYVLSPTAPITAFDALLPAPTNDPMRPLEHIAFTVPCNMSEQPAASIACAMTQAGLPIGLQIAGPRFDDLGVLQLAHAFEQLRAPLPPWPQPPAKT
ncbi:amidase [Comamonas sp.]|uniref:amidase n=1 Tax=Comamonas sp. TaxID=34028 RepID=UPI00095C892D|nr:amidase [Comamonas sp.]MBN9329299.1 amidase [Comamonas sp.]OJX02610.1 MAG: amidase [Burkholderiales bacterium 66-26]